MLRAFIECMVNRLLRFSGITCSVQGSKLHLHKSNIGFTHFGLYVITLRRVFVRDACKDSGGQNTRVIFQLAWRVDGDCFPQGEGVTPEQISCRKV